MFLGLAMQQIQLLSTAHALAVFALGLRFAFSRDHQIQAIYTLAYVSTADVFWRMTKAGVFWEYGKYATVAILFVLLVRNRSLPGLSSLALLYGLLLIPSVALTVGQMGLGGELRRALSFNLSGPLALIFSVIFFSGYAGPRIPLGKMLTWALMPVVGIFSIAAFSTLTARTLNFYDAANLTASGGFGPNQVASALGLGIFFCFLLAIKIPSPWLRVMYLGLAMVLAFQAILTFSHGGVFNVLIALGFMGFHSLTNPKIRKSFFVILVLGATVASFLLYPRLNDWTQGMVSKRFTSLDTTGRQSLAEADIRLFFENPALGVGPGRSRYERKGAFRQKIAAHTEFTRLLAEHGTLGLCAAIVLLLIVLKAYQLAPTLLAKGWVTSFSAWTAANMMHSGMRLAAMSLMFGLATLPFHYWQRRDRASSGEADLG